MLMLAFAIINTSFVFASCKTETINNSKIPYIINENWKQIVIQNWIKWKKFDSIRNLTYSPDWTTFAYLAENNDSIYTHLIKDWKELTDNSPVSHDLTYGFKYSNDYKSFSYMKLNPNRISGNFKTSHILIKDWKEIAIFRRLKTFGYLENWSLYYVIDNRSNLDENFWKDWDFIVWKDWIELWKYRWVWFINKWYNSFAYEALWNISEKTGTFKDWIYLWNSSLIWELKYSPNGKSFSFVKTEALKKTLVKDWIEISKDYDRVLYFDYSNDSQNFKYVVKKENKEKIFVFKNGKLEKTYNSSSDYNSSIEKARYNYSLNLANNSYDAGWFYNDFNCWYKTSNNWKNFIQVICKYAKSGLWHEVSGSYIIWSNWLKTDVYKNLKILLYSEDWKSVFYEVNKNGKKNILKTTCSN